jgi:riboflavin transporter FmnP
MLLMIGAPYIPAAILFACLFGFGNGLFSIISGSLPLFLFGSTGYGAMQGKLMSARLVLSAIAPFAMAFALKNTSVYITLAIIIVVSIAGGGLYFIIKQGLQTRALN